MTGTGPAGDASGAPLVRVVASDGAPTFELLLRAGVADESLRQRGAVRLLAAQAVLGATPAQVPDPQVDTDLLLTTVRGGGPTVRAATAVLVRVVERLVAPSPARLARVRDVPPPPPRKGDVHVAELLAARCGLRGPGLLHVPELPPSVLVDATVRTLARRHVRAGALGVVLRGAWAETDARRVARELAGRLPDGRADVGSPPVLLRGARWVPGEAGTVAVGGLVPRGPAGELLARLLHDRLDERLRAAGLAYGVGVAREPLDAAVAHLTVLVEPLRDAGGDVAEEVLAEVARLARGGPDAEELRRLRDGRLREVTAAPLPGEAALASVRAGLLDAARRAPEDRPRLVEAVDAAAVADAATSVRRALVAVLPPFAAAPARLPGPGAREHPAPPVAPRHLRWRARRGPLRLRVADGVLAVVDPHRPEDPLASPVLRLADTALHVVRPSGRRSTWDTSGAALHLRPQDWRGGEAAVAALDAAVPAAAVLRVPDEVRLPPLPRV